MNLYNAPITTAGTIIVGPVQFTQGPPEKVTLQTNFVYGSGGTSIDVYVQTSIDGVTWIDISNFHATTANARTVVNLLDDVAVSTPVVPTDGALTANTAISGILDAVIRLKIVTVAASAYVGTTLSVDASVR
jgi:hypothetical protein